MTAIDFDALRQELEADEDLNCLQVEGSAEVSLKCLRTVQKQIEEREKKEARLRQQLQHDAQRIQAQAEAQAEEDAAVAAAVQQQQGALHDLLAADRPGGLTMSAPEPPCMARVLAPWRAPPATPDLSGIPCVSTVVTSCRNATGTEVAALAALGQLLADPCCLPSCPDEATARAAFHVISSAPDPQLAQHACSALLRWSGASIPELDLAGELAAGAPGLLAAVGGVCAGGGGTGASSATSSCSLPWVPDTQDFLDALQQLGYSSQQQHHGRGGSNTAAAAEASSSGRDSVQQLPQLVNVRQLLRLAAGLWRATAAGRVAVPLPEGRARELAGVLLELHLDEALAAGGALGEVRDAFGALLGAFPERGERALLEELARRIGAPLAPSHRAAVMVLRLLPRAGARAAALRRAAAVALVETLLSLAPSARSGRGGSSSAAASPQALLALLPERGKVLPALAGSCKVKGERDYWALISLVDAVDVALWSYVNAPAEGDATAATLDDAVAKRFSAWLQDVPREIGADMRAHHVKPRIAALDNRYSFSVQLGMLEGDSQLY